MDPKMLARVKAALEKQHAPTEQLEALRVLQEKTQQVPRKRLAGAMWLLGATSRQIANALDVQIETAYRYVQNELRSRMQARGKGAKARLGDIEAASIWEWITANAKIDQTAFEIAGAAARAILENAREEHEPRID